MEKLVPALRESLFTPTYDLTGELLELGIDSLLDNEILKSIPVVNSITTLCKVGYNLHERNLIKQTLSFINGFNSGNVDPVKLAEYSQELQNTPKKQEQELGRVIIILGKQVEEIQSKVLGSFYLAYTKRAISWEKFCELSEANRRMFVSDYAILSDAVCNNGLNFDQGELYQVDRLISLGLLQNNNRLGGTIVANFTDVDRDEKDVIPTSFGRTFYQHMPRT